MMRFHLKKEWAIPSGVGIVSFGIGVGVGYAFKGFRENQNKNAEFEDTESESGNREYESEDAVNDSDNVQLELSYEESDFRYEEKLSAFRHAMQEATLVIRELKDEGKSFLEQRASEMQRSMAAHPAFQEIEIEEDRIDVGEEPYVIPDTIFKDNSDGDWNMEAEMDGRSAAHPYIIHHDEFYNAENEGFDCTQTTLTYYKGDDILCDEQDVPIYEYLKLTGELKFGHGSKDPSVVYIRNEALGAEYEVLLDHGYFQTEILGQQLEDDLNKDVKHSVRKFRLD
jgi:hypothetical protein